MEYEIIGEKGNYREPSVPDNKPTWHYTAVRVDYQFPPNIPYEILEDLYLPKEDATLGSQNSRNNEDDSFIHALEDESMFLTKNIAMTEATANQRLNWTLLPPPYRPRGYIKMWDAENNLIGIQGVEVRAGYWYYYSTGITSSGGNYECNNTFRYAVQYYLDWEKYHFAIERDNGYQVAAYWGLDQKADWNLVISRDTDEEQWKYGEMYRAAYKLYYGYIVEMNRPPENCPVCDQMDIQLE
ncbi:MAG: hypothetical protein QM536_08945 [Chitinophagaceae bacterium]|nr:hypothetical protein [Chitinophagaceae bacterium]